MMNAREPDRISRSSVVALALGLLGCVPMVGFLGAILGVVTLYRIGGSGGRLGGRTPAAVGLALGLISTAGWLSLGLGMRQAYAGYSRDLARPTVEYFRHRGRGREGGGSAVRRGAGAHGGGSRGVWSGGKWGARAGAGSSDDA
jgi:hypothetical protein